MKKENRYHFLYFMQNNTAECRDEYWMWNLLFFATFISDHWQCLKKVFFEFRKKKFQRITHNSQLSSVLKFIPHTCDVCVWIYSKFFALSKNEKNQSNFNEAPLHCTIHLSSALAHTYFVINKKPLSQNYESILMFFLSFYSLIDDSLSYWNKFKGREVCSWRDLV